MSQITLKRSANNEPVFDIELADEEKTISLATANTYVDKNIVFNVNVDKITNPEIDKIFADNFLV